MKNTKEQIRVIAEKVMKDFWEKDYSENCIGSVVFSEKDEILDGSLKPIWAILLNHYSITKTI